MPKSLTLGNGSVHIGLDQYGQVKDFYYAYPGLENHVSEGLIHKIGVWVEKSFSWVDNGSWNISIDAEKGTMASKIEMRNDVLGIELFFNDIVYNEKNIFVRHVTMRNLFDRNRNIKLFFNQQFNAGHGGSGDTAYYDPRSHALIHYKGRRVFLTNAICDVAPHKKKNARTQAFNEFSTGILGQEGKEGTFKDAEDGELGGNPIEHGQVDSVLGMDLELAPHGEKSIYYWVIAAKSIQEAKQLNEYVYNRGPDSIINSTKNYWKAWIYNQNFSFYGLSEKIINLFNTSLVQIRTHVAKNGAIIASTDSDLLKHGRDTYSYVWPRDAALSALALIQAGDFNASHRFFEFCNQVITSEGYFMHKYLPDYSLGSSWHPWVRDGKTQIPLQEDETALVLNALWKHYELSKDLEFIESIYNSLIKNAAEFMVSYRDKNTGLPKPSYDLWEEKYGISTFTSASVYGALISASKFAKLLGKGKFALRYRRAAKNIQAGIMKYLYDEKEGYFYKLIQKKGNDFEINRTIDMSSVYGIHQFRVLPFDDPRLKKAFDISVERLSVDSPIGGIARYEGDAYHGVDPKFPGNPWIITTAWYVQYLIEFIQTENELPEIVKRFTWFVDHALQSGVLPEQLNPLNGDPLSATPLTWSHAEFVKTIIMYLQKLEDLGVCKACYPVDN